MGNTVGSREDLTDRQKEIIIGTLLGDGHLEKNGRYTRLRVDHYNRHKEYIFLLVKELAPFSLLPRTISETDKRNGKVYSRWHFSTKSLPIFDEFRELFYVGKRKIIPERLENLLHLCLWQFGIWMMVLEEKTRKGFIFVLHRILRKSMQFYKRFCINVL